MLELMLTYLSTDFSREQNRVENSQRCPEIKVTFEPVQSFHRTREEIDNPGSSSLKGLTILAAGGTGAL